MCQELHLDQGVVGRAQAWLPGLVAAATFAVIAAALECHVNEAKRRGWSLPNQLLEGLSLESPDTRHSHTRLGLGRVVLRRLTGPLLQPTQYFLLSQQQSS